MSLESALRAHLRKIRTNRRAMREDAAGRNAVKVDGEAVARFRARAGHLDSRLPADSHRRAAWAGLQDTVPRAALTSLHARMAGIEPGSWEHPSLAQVWFRWSDYVVPEEDLAVFTLGALPRDAEVAEVMDLMGRAVDHILDRPRGSREVEGAMPEALARLGHPTAMRQMTLLRLAQPSGRFRIRWDARHVSLFPVARQDRDPEPSRLELARRFLRWHGPAAPGQFAWWAAITAADAALTWEALRYELVEVSLTGRARWLLARDLDDLLHAPEPRGVRFLPLGDSYLALDRELVEVYEVDRLGRRSPPPSQDERGRELSRRLLNSLVGRILVDGRIVGSWGRERWNLSLHLWPDGAGHLDRVLAEAESMAGPSGRPMTIRQLR